MPERDSTLEGERRARLVLADDNELVRDVVARLLVRRAAVDIVSICRDGEEAVRACTELKPDIALFDLRMPKLDGVEATNRVTATIPGVSVVILSGSASKDDQQRAFAAGAVGYVVKRADVTEIVAAVEAIRRGETYVSPAVATA